MSTEKTEKGTFQKTEGADGAAQEIYIDVLKDKAELGVNDAKVSLSYQELWEHVHNCLDALERLGRDRRK